jgi:zinc protease
MISRLIARAGIAALLLILPALPARAIPIERVVTPGGIEAWLVRDEKNPIIALDFSFTGGSTLDPADKLGLATMTMSLLDEGAGDLDSQAFQRRLEENSITLGFSAGREEISGSLTTLVETKGEAFELLRLALASPRFDDPAVERVRAQITAGLKRAAADPNYTGQVTFAETLFPGHPYGKPPRGTIGTVQAITVADLRGFVRDRIARDTLKIGVSGDITAAELATALDAIFGGLPAMAAPFTVAQTVPAGAGAKVLVERPIPQSILFMGQPGLKRSDPDWFPALILNYVLGGGGFSSRLMDEVREKRGLTYGVSSGLQPYEQSALWTVGGSTANEKAVEALALIKKIWGRTARDGITAAELQDAKTFLTGSFPLTFTSNEAIAGVLLSVQEDDLGIDYLNQRNALIEAVTLERVNAVAKRLLDPAKLATVVVGRPVGLEPTRVVDGGS